MTDAPENGDGAPALSPEQQEAEQLHAHFVMQITQQAQQLLALVGVALSPDELVMLQRGAAVQLNAQTQLLDQILPTFDDLAAKANPGFGVQLFKANASRIVLPGQKPEQPFPILGPKRLPRGSAVAASVAATLSSLAFLLNPAFRLAAEVLGVHVNFIQAHETPGGGGTGGQRQSGKWNGMARR